MSKPVTVSHLTSHLGYWLRYVSNAVSQAFARKLESEDVTVAEWVVLRELYGAEDAVSPSKIAERLDLTRGAVSKLVDRLLAKDLVIREDSKHDGRAHRLRLSAVGRKLVPRLSGLADRNDAEFFDHLSAKDRQVLETLLKTIIARRGLKQIPLS